MPKTYSIIEFQPNGTWTTIYKVSIPDIGEKGFYRTAVSVDAFSAKEGKRLYDCALKGIPNKSRWFSVYREDDFLRYDGMMRNIGLTECFKSQWESVPFVVCGSIWDFYTKVGYDYKKKRYAAKDS